MVGLWGRCLLIVKTKAYEDLKCAQYNMISDEMKIDLDF
jgi:hypothetical protein